MHHVHHLITSISKLKMLGGYASPPDHVHGPWSTFMSITNLKMLGGYDRLTSRIF